MVRRLTSGGSAGNRHHATIVAAMLLVLLAIEGAVPGARDVLAAAVFGEVRALLHGLRRRLQRGHGPTTAGGN